MTKKFWKDWQKRIGETRDICLFKRSHIDGRTWKSSCGLLGLEDRIAKVTFHEKSVDLIVERKTYVFGINGLHIHSENEHLTLNRNDIATIDFLRK